MSAPSSRPVRSSRIPVALQAVFLASNRGQEVHVPPAEASKTFVRKNQGKPRLWQRLFRRKRGSNKTSREGVDHTECTSSEDCETTDAALLSETPQTSTVRAVSPDASSPSCQVKQASSHKGTLNSRNFYQSMAVPKNAEQNINTVPSKPSHHSLPEHVQSLSSKQPVKKCQEDVHEEDEDLVSPQIFLDQLLRSRGYSTARFPSLQTAYANPPTALQKASHTAYLVDAVRANNTSKIRAMLKAGLSPNPCNDSGESVLHLTARQSQDATLLQLLLDHGATVQCVDDFGRSPLHDACWRTAPCWDIVSVILQQDARLVHVMDCRSATPLSYVPRSQWTAWRCYLLEVQDRFWPIREGPSTQSFPPLVMQKPGSRPLSDPSHVALPIKVATLLAQGRLSPKEARWLVEDDNDSSLSDSLGSEDDEASLGDSLSSSLYSEDGFGEIPRFVEVACH